MFLSGCAASISSDRWNHFGFSASMASVGTAASSKPLESAGIVFGLGLLKEVYDQLCGSGFQAGDLAADFAGSFLGGWAAAEMRMEDFP